MDVRKAFRISGKLRSRHHAITHGLTHEDDRLDGSVLADNAQAFKEAVFRSATSGGFLDEEDFHGEGQAAFRIAMDSWIAILDGESDGRIRACVAG